jgi:V/A-type H+-transporting ATPase subunit I
MITGFLFNSFFGDFIPRFIYGDATKMIYNAEIFGISLPIDAIHKPVLILSIALILGLAHLNVGFILAVYKNLKRGHVKDIFIEQIPWFMLEIGGGMLIGETLLELWQLSSIAKMIAGIFTVIGLISLFKRNGALGFFEITGFLGDWLSYARLLALGLATAGMALAFNVIAELLPDIIPYVGIVLVPILLVVAHFANLLIQSLGAAIHSLRLQYVEFFNRFYEGGGKKFMPFQIRRKYTEEIK